jgi:hypothetical protein
MRRGIERLLEDEFRMHGIDAPKGAALTIGDRMLSYIHDFIKLEGGVMVLMREVENAVETARMDAEDRMARERKLAIKGEPEMKKEKVKW